MADDLPPGSQLTDHMIAGSLSGIVEHASVYPIDTVKTHIQASAEGAAASRSAVGVTRSLVRQHGVVHLYRGISALLPAIGPAHALMFSGYEQCLHLGCAREAGASTERVAVVGAIAGVVSTILHDSVMVPAETVKQRMQLGYYRNALHCAQAMLASGGGSFYRSLPTTLAMNAPYCSLMMMSNESPPASSKDAASTERCARGTCLGVRAAGARLLTPARNAVARRPKKTAEPFGHLRLARHRALGRALGRLRGRAHDAPRRHQDQAAGPVAASRRQKRRRGSRRRLHRALPGLLGRGARRERRERPGGLLAGPWPARRDVRAILCDLVDCVRKREKYVVSWPMLRRVRARCRRFNKIMLSIKAPLRFRSDPRGQPRSVHSARMINRRGRQEKKTFQPLFRQKWRSGDDQDAGAGAPTPRTFIA